MRVGGDGVSTGQPQSFGSAERGNSQFHRRPSAPTAEGPTNQWNRRTEPGLLSYLDRPAGCEALDETDFFIPRYKLTQPNTCSEEEVPGLFQLQLAGAADASDGRGIRQALKVVPLRVWKGRVLWTENHQGGPCCRSADNSVPDPVFWMDRRGEPPSRVCGRMIDGRWRAACPFARWSQEAPPECREYYELLFLDPDDRLPYLIGFQGTAVKPFRRFVVSVIRMRVARISDVRARLTASVAEGSEGRYYIPQFLDIQRNRSGEFDGAFDEFRMYEPFHNRVAKSIGSVATPSGEPRAHPPPLSGREKGTERVRP